MLNPFWDREGRVARWVEDHIDHAGPFGNCQAMGVSRDGELVAGFVFHNWDARTGTIEVSGAAVVQRWATKTVVRTALDYVFIDCGCQMLYARQHLANEPARRAWLGLGADEVVIPRLFGRDTVGTVITLTDDQWWSSRIGRR